MTRLAVSGQSCVSMHHSTPCILILTHWISCVQPSIVSLFLWNRTHVAAAALEDPGITFTRIKRSVCVRLSCRAGGRKRVCMHVAYLSIALLQESLPLLCSLCFPPLSTGVNTPGETNRWMTLKEGGFCPMRSYPFPPSDDPNPGNTKQIQIPVRRRFPQQRHRGVVAPVPAAVAPSLSACLPAYRASLSRL